MLTPNVLAIIPARGGSKGVAGKNIRPLLGKPLIGYAIETSLACPSINFTIVNTEDDKIEAIAKLYEVTIQKREAAYATDDAPILPVVLSSLAYAEHLNQMQFDIVVLLQPTAPFRTAQDASNIIQLLANNPDADAAISVVSVGDNHPSRMYTLDQHGHMFQFLDKQETDNRQLLSPVYIRNGCFYAIKRAALVEQQTLMPKQKLAYVMPSAWHVNIDEEKDFLLAEILTPLWQKSNA